MKIEKMNDQQIRCTLTKEDLAEHQIKLAELAYGTDKARSLFKEMMLQAENEFGFMAEDMPLMIEAVPISPDSIVLIVTKVEDPEELDTRFAQFSPSLINDEDSDYSGFEDVAGEPDELMGLFKQIAGSALKKETTGSSAADSSESPSAAVAITNLQRLFSFDSMENLFRVSKVIANDFDKSNSLYKSKDSKYLLLLNQENMDITAYNRICNIVSEYGNSEKSLAATDAYLAEHCELIIGNDAIQKLSLV